MSNIIVSGKKVNSFFEYQFGGSVDVVPKEAVETIYNDTVFELTIDGELMPKEESEGGEDLCFEYIAGELTPIF